MLTSTKQVWRKVKTFYKYKGYKYEAKECKAMKVNIIYSPDGWIMTKFPTALYEELQGLGMSVALSQEYDSSADINCFYTLRYEGEMNKHTTFMITHVMKGEYLAYIREKTEQGAIGICMSRATRDLLISYGIRPDRVCYINPAQDGQIRPRKVVLGFTHRRYKDYRKRETMLIDICQRVNPEVFRFVIMGAGWEDIIAELNQMGFETEYYPEFDKQKYNELMPNLDYYCYFGFDEGSMGYLDAVAAGIGTIVTPQGYHLDTDCEITYPVSTIDEIVDALHDIENKRRKNLRFAETWTWRNYALKHLELWKYMLECEDLNTLLSTRGWYNDGIYSLPLLNTEPYISLKDKAVSYIQRHRDSADG